MNKHEQLYQLAKNVLPFLPISKIIDGKVCKLYVSKRKAEYTNGELIVSFSGHTTLKACIKALEWHNKTLYKAKQSNDTKTKI